MYRTKKASQTDGKPVGAHSICAGVFLAAGTSTGGYGIRPYGHAQTLLYYQILSNKFPRPALRVPLHLGGGSAGNDTSALLTAAGCNYFMGIPHGDDIMLNYQTTGFRETAALREIFHLTAIPPFQAWLEKMGFVENGRLTPKAGDGSVLL